MNTGPDMQAGVLFIILKHHMSYNSLYDILLDQK